MAYVDSSGKTHVSLSEASRGHAAQTTASRNAAGQIVGSSSGSNYAREEEQKIRDTIQYNTGMPSWATAPGETAGIDRSQLQNFQTVDQLEAERERGTISRTLSTYKQGYVEGRAGSVSLNSLKESASSPGWKLEGQIIGKTVSVVENAIGKDNLKAYSTGYALGRGKEADINSLQAPKQRANEMVSYPLYQWTNKGTEYLSSLRDKAVKPVPDSTAKDVIVGLSDLPIYAVGLTGGVPMGLETIARNPSSAIDSIGLGLGLIAGGTVTTAEKEPGRLAGQLIGGYALGKGAGAAYSKLKAPKLKEVPIETTERQFQVLEGVEKTNIETLGTPREYLKIKTRTAGEGELNPVDINTAEKYLSQDSRTFEVRYTKTSSLTDSSLNTEVRSGSGLAQVTLKRPSVLNAEQKTLTGETLVQVDKGKWKADFSGLPKDKFSLNKQYTVENYLGKETFDYEFATSVENIRARPIKEITQIPETPKELPIGAEQYFDVPKTKQLDLFSGFGSNSDSLASVQYRSLNLFPGEKPGFFAYDKIQFGKNSFKNTVRRLTSDESGSLAPVREPQVIPGGIKSELDVWKRDIILEELQPKTSIEIKTFELPRTYSSVSWGSSGALLSQFSNLQLGESAQNKVYTPSSIRVWSENAPQISIKSDVLEKSDINLLTGSGNIFGTWEDTKQDSRQDSKQDTKTMIDVIPDIAEVPINDIPPKFDDPIKPNPIGTPTPFYDYIPTKKIPLPLGDNLSLFSSDEPGPRRRKTRHKTIKNAYGDPLKIKLKL